jgi:hypothetical protein
MGRCPWHSNPCDCDGTTHPHGGRFAKWSPINGVARRGAKNASR